MFKAVNCMLVTIIPKTDNATMVKDFRPISCFSILYKIISTILTARMSKVYRSVIDDS